jgi:glutamate-5-semialdehyde dehydrogenase
MNRRETIAETTESLMLGIGQAARSAARALALAPTEQKNAALTTAAAALRKATPAIIAANAKDVAAAKAADRPASFIDRLLLDAKRIEGVAKSLEDIAALADPVGTVLA